MSAQDTSADASPATITPASRPSVPAPPSWPWRRSALLLAGGAQLITISALVGVDPPPATSSSLVLATAPVPLAAIATFGRGRANRLAAVAGVLVVVAGIAGAIAHTGLFFVPALVALLVGGVKLWRERS